MAISLPAYGSSSFISCDILRIKILVRVGLLLMSHEPHNSILFHGL